MKAASAAGRFEADSPRNTPRSWSPAS